MILTTVFFLTCLILGNTCKRTNNHQVWIGFIFSSAGAMTIVGVLLELPPLSDTILGTLVFTGGAVVMLIGAGLSVLNLGVIDNE